MLREDEENYEMRNFKAFTVHQQLLDSKMSNVKLDKAVTQIAVMTNDTKVCSAKVKKLLDRKRRRWDHNIKVVVKIGRIGVCR
jgi:hypothetical protein